MSEISLPTAPVIRPRADACLSFANTLCWRGRQTPTESLRELADVVRWAAGSAGLPDAAVQTWLRQGDQQGSEARRLFGQAIALREAIYGIFSALAAGLPIAEADIAALNAGLAEAPERRELAAVDDAYAWRLPAQPLGVPALLAPVLWSAADLLTQGRPGRIRQCANDQCLWLFIDESRNGTRRWCDMASCGNRAKARRHYLRHKKV